MEPFELSLKQVNFEEQDLSNDDTLNAFSNIVSYNEDFKDPDSNGLPVLARKVKPASTGSQSSLSHFTNYLESPKGERDTSSIQKEERNQSGHVDQDESPTYLHYLPQPLQIDYDDQQGISKETQVVNKEESPANNSLRSSVFEENQADYHNTSSPSQPGDGVTSTTQTVKEEEYVSDDEAFQSFTATVEALALQKSVIGSTEIIPATAEQIAAAIAQTQQKLGAAILQRVGTPVSSPLLSDEHTDGEEESIQITLTNQGQYDIVLKEKDGTKISTPVASNGNIIITSPLNAAGDNIANLSLHQDQDAQHINQGVEECDAHAYSHSLNDVNIDDLKALNGENYHLNRSEDLGMDLSGKHLIRSYGPKDPDYVNVKYISTNGGQQKLEFVKRPPSPKEHDYVNVTYFRKAEGSEALEIESPHNESDSLNESRNSILSADGEKELIRIRADEITIEKSTNEKSSWFASSPNVPLEKKVNLSSNISHSSTPLPVSTESPVPSTNTIPKTTDTVLAPAQQNISISDPNLIDSNVQRDSIKKVPSHEDHRDMKSQVDMQRQPGRNRAASDPMNRQGQPVLAQRRSSHGSKVKAPLANMAEFDLGEGNQLYYDHENPQINAENAQPVPKYLDDGRGERKTENKVVNLQQGQRVNVVTSSRAAPVTSVPEVNTSPDLQNAELDKVIKERAKLEGRLEIAEKEARTALTERAELQAQLAGLTQYLKSQDTSMMTLVAERDDMKADLDTLRQNRSRLEQVIVDAQKLLEDKDLELRTLREDIMIGKQTQEKLGDNITGLKRELQAKDTTVQDLKSKIAELYVQFQTSNQSRLLLENEVKSLQSEIASLTTAKEWYQQQLSHAQDGKQLLQKDITNLKSEQIAQGTLIERLKADNLRARQQITETQQRMIQEKELLARHLEAIEADMLEREAAFAQIQRDRDLLQETIQQNAPVSAQHQATIDMATHDLEAELKKAQNELKRKTAHIAVVEHEKAELMKRITLSQESLLERDRSLETLEQKYVDLEVEMNRLTQELGFRDEAISKINQEKSMVEIELRTVKEEKKTFDDALQVLKDDMGKVERSFRHMKSELAQKTNELNHLKGARVLTSTPSVDNSVSDTDDAKLLKEHNTKLKKQLQTYREKALHEIADLKSQNQNLTLEISKLKSSIILSETKQSSSSSPDQEISPDATPLHSSKSNDSEVKESLEKEISTFTEKIVQLEQSLEALSAEKAKESTMVALSKKENEELRIQLADLQRESHKEIAKQKAKVLKLGKDLELTLRDKRETQRSLQTSSEELQMKLQLLESQKATLKQELEQVVKRTGLDYDDKTKHLQEELQAVKHQLEEALESRISIESQLKENQGRVEVLQLDCESYQVKIKSLEDEATGLRKVVDKHRELELEEEKRRVELELEKEKGRLAGLTQSYEQLKQHTVTLEAALAGKETSAVQFSSHAAEEINSKMKEIADLNDQIRNLNDLLHQEKQNVKEGKKQLLTEKGNHVKTRRRLETLWVEHDQLKVDLRQKLSELEKLQATFEKSRENELKQKMSADSAQTEVKSLKLEVERQKRDALERQAKDPVVHEQIQSLEWQLNEKKAEIGALKSQLQFAEDRQIMEVNSLQMTLQTQQKDCVKLREEMALIRREKSNLQATVTEFKSALKECVNYIKVVEKQVTTSEVSSFDLTSLEKLLEQKERAVQQSKPLSFLRSTLSDLRGEITSLQDQMEEHVNAVQTSSQAWRDLEHQVRDLREVCKTSAAMRANNQTSNHADVASHDAIIPPIPAAAAAIVSGKVNLTNQAATASDPTITKVIKTTGLAPNAIYSPGKTPSKNT